MRWIPACHLYRKSRKSTGVIKTITDGSVLFNCPSMSSLLLLFRPVLFLLWHFQMSSVKKATVFRVKYYWMYHSTEQSTRISITPLSQKWERDSRRTCRHISCPKKRGSRVHKGSFPNSFWMLGADSKNNYCSCRQWFHRVLWWYKSTNNKATDPECRRRLKCTNEKVPEGTGQANQPEWTRHYDEWELYSQ